MRIPSLPPSSTHGVTTETLPARGSGGIGTGASAAAAKPAGQDGFAARSGRAPVSLAMPPPPVTAAPTEQARPAESLWYRAKKHVVLFFTGIDYDPHVHKLDQSSAARLAEVLQPGDVLLRRTDGTTSNWVIPGYWGHAALYAGEGKILDATTHDAREIDLARFCGEGDAVIVVRPKAMTGEQKADSVAYARAQIGKPYDYDLDFEDESRFTCTELVESSLRSATGRGWAEGNVMGISPKDFLNDRFDFVWSSLGTMVR